MKASIFCSVLLLAVFLDTGAQKLYQASMFISPKTFTEGIEGASADKDGNIYAVNYQQKGTIGKISPDGNVSLLITLRCRRVVLQTEHTLIRTATFL